MSEIMNDSYAVLLPVNVFSPVQISAIVSGIACSLLAVPGVICNILSIFIFSRVGETTLSTSLYKILALADSGVLLIMAVNWSPLAWHMLFGDWLQYLMWISPALQYLNYLEETLRDFAVWMVVFVTLARYTKIYCPAAHVRCTPGYAKCSFLMLLFLAVFNSYILITAPLDPMVDESSGSINASFYSIDCMLNILTPVAAVFIMTVRVVIAIKMTQMARSPDSCRRHLHTWRRDYAATRTLITIVIVFLVCQGPVCIHLIVEAVCHRTQRAEVLIPYTQAAAVIFQCINSMANFFVFYFKTHKFRHAFLVMWHRWCTCLKFRFSSSPPSSSTSSTPPPKMRSLFKHRYYLQTPV